MNRLTLFGDSSPLPQTLERRYKYLNFGNRALDSTSQDFTVNPFYPAVTEVYEAFDLTNNRYVGPDPQNPVASYDRAGNMTLTPAGETLGYDGENRLIEFKKGGSTDGEYFYDGEGRRVRRFSRIAGATKTTTYAYDAFGSLAAEYSSKAPSESELGLKYRTTDHLGSTRVLSSAGGDVCHVQDHFPFGEEIPDGANGREQIANYGSGCKGVSQRFTAKERDSETGLDYFGVRYMSSAQGRFTSSDPLLSSGRPWEPQSWNRYAYTLNNPLKYVDPNGLYEWSQNCNNDDQECQANRQQFRDALATIKDAVGKLDEGSEERNKLQAVLDRYGDEGEKNKMFIKFGPAGGFPASESTSFFRRNHTVTFDVNMIKNMFNNSESVNPAYKASTGWGEIVAHEGAHMLDSFMFGNPVNRNGALRTEVNAFDAQSFVPKALNVQSMWNL